MKRATLSVIELRDQLCPPRFMTLADLRKSDIEIRKSYHEIVDAIVNPRMPTLLNTDGDPLEMTTMTYELGVATAEGFERLRPLATLRGQVHADDERYDAAGAIEAAVLTWIKAGNRQHKDRDNTTLGTLRLDGSRLVIEVNSARRRKRIAKEISKRFGSTRRSSRRRRPTSSRNFRTDARAAAKSLNPRRCHLSRSELLRSRRSRQR